MPSKKDNSPEQPFTGPNPSPVQPIINPVQPVIDPVQPIRPTPLPGPLPGPVPGPLPVPSPVPTPVPTPTPTPGTNATALSPQNPSVTTSAPNSSVSVTVPNTSGTVTFSLVVTDNLGVQSAPVFATVTIQGAPEGNLAVTPSVVMPGGAIELSAANSSSTGSIVSYTFSLVPPSPAPPVS